MTVKVLRENGYKVRVFHERVAKKSNKLVRYSRRVKGIDVLPKGGRTSIIICDIDNKFLGVGIAECSKQDIFCYKEGVKFALQRAFEMAKNTQQAQA